MAAAGDSRQGGALAPPCLDAPPLRVVLDTNVLLSLWAFVDSRFAPLRQRVECRAWLALTRDDCLAEFHRVLGYPEFGLSTPQQSEIFAAYARVARVHSEQPQQVCALPRCKDRDDQKFLELARDAAADWLITADKALLRLARGKKLQGLFRIITPQDALNTLG
ncbi:MAG: putative toxin-antitoxin system toxin component, PIN family [Rhodocyclaceae bacterium]|jgi:putative PIN family toxin of toxin-antitoxin system|nr:putative toxin-antitoxin system toxin component, PIN family [Rhodocyclaceae bacterium]